ncbi:hypothetical protein NPIL_629981 [Nephila pilipes]|uniref:Uncharacterized protein n=1 Tax=Nephila pilipes TaxID=299642 RepID=A0A8X6R1I7_NEPPI|nr:hypothetical protein NPIL_629981 [Nephila pilipes]
MSQASTLIYEMKNASGGLSNTSHYSRNPAYESLSDGGELNSKELYNFVSEISIDPEKPLASKKNKLDPSIMNIKRLNSLNTDNESVRMPLDSELEKSNLIEKFHKSDIDTNVFGRKSAEVLDKSTKDSENVDYFFLSTAISVLKSLDENIAASLKISQTEMYKLKIPGMRSRLNSDSSEKMNSPVEMSPKNANSPVEMSPKNANSPVEMSPKNANSPVEKFPSKALVKSSAYTEENLCEGIPESKCFNCTYFGNMDDIYYMQQELIDIRTKLGELAKRLLKECNNFDGHNFVEIESILKGYEAVKEKSKKFNDDFEESDFFFHLDPWDAIGGLRLSSQIMYFKYLLVENDKYLESFKLANFVMKGLKELLG